MLQYFVSIKILLCEKNLHFVKNLNIIYYLKIHI